MKKLLVLFLALSIFVTVFVSCHSFDQNGDITSTSAEVTSIEELTSMEETTEAPESISKVSIWNVIKKFDSKAKSFANTAGCREMVLNGVSKKDLLDALKAEDFVELENVQYVEGAKFETIILERANNIVTMYCDEANDEIRVMLETNKNIIPLNPTEETGKGVLTVAQVGVERMRENDNPLIGMCYVIKLSNGNAIVIDGGFNTKICAENLYNTLEKLDIEKSQNKYVIEAWIITHAHNDHTGAYKAFSSIYSSKATVKNIMQSFPSSENLVVGGGKNFSREKFSEASLIIPHAGLKYHFGNATISMLYTPEMLYTATSQLDYFNDTSLVFKIEIGNSSVLFMGDAGDVVSTELIASYNTSALKSNIFQLSHHGLYTSAGSTHNWTNQKMVYDAIDADYVFLPMHEYLEGNSRNGRHTVLISWAASGYQISYVMNTSDNHGLWGIDQNYYTDFVNSVANGTAIKPTLYGYDGINKIVNQNGLITYLGANETDPMITIFELNGDNVTLKTNEELHKWLGK